MAAKNKGLSNPYVKVNRRKRIGFNFSDKHKRYIKNCANSTYNILEGAVRSGKTVDNVFAFAHELKTTKDRIHLATGSTMANAKLNIGDANGFGLEYAELEAAIDADKKIQVVDVKAGGYVSKEKLDAKITELDGVKQQLSDANTTIQSYKDMDIDGIKQSAKDWETKYTQETQKLTAQLAAQERTHALDMFMGGYKFSSKPAENGVRAEFEKKNFTLEDGKFLGGDEFMKSLMENDDYKGAFVIEDDNDPEDDSHEDEEGKPFFARGVGGTGGAGGEGVKGKEAPFNPFGFNLIRQPDKN